MSRKGARSLIGVVSVRSLTLLWMIVTLATSVLTVDSSPAFALTSESPARISMLEEAPNPLTASDGDDDSSDDSDSQDSESSDSGE